MSSLEKELNPKTIDEAPRRSPKTESNFEVLSNNSIFVDNDINSLLIDDNIFHSKKVQDNQHSTQLIKEKKLNMFKKLMNVFKSISFIKKYIPLSEEELLHQKVNNKIKDFIKKEEWSNLDKVIKTGFKISPEIQNLIDDKIERTYLINRQYETRGIKDNIEHINDMISKYASSPSFISKNILMKITLKFTQIFDVFYHESNRDWFGTKKYDIFIDAVKEFKESKTRYQPPLYIEVMDKTMYGSSLEFNIKTLELSSVLNQTIRLNKEEFINYFLKNLNSPTYTYKSNGELIKEAHFYDLDLLIHPYNVIIKNIIKKLDPLLVKKVYTEYRNYIDKYKNKKKQFVSHYIEDIKKAESILGEIESIMGGSPQDIQEVLDIAKKLSPNLPNNEEVFVIQESFSIDDLPLNIKTLYESIKEKFTFIIENKNSMNEEDLFVTNKIMKERIPKIIQKFMLFDEEDLISMKNSEGKDPKEICIETLIGIDNKFKNIIDSFKENNLSELSAMSRYVKKM